MSVFSVAAADSRRRIDLSSCRLDRACTETCGPASASNAEEKVAFKAFPTGRAKHAHRHLSIRRLEELANTREDSIQRMRNDAEAVTRLLKGQAKKSLDVQQSDKQGGRCDRLTRGYPRSDGALRRSHRAGRDVWAEEEPST